MAAGEDYRRIPRGRRHERWVGRVTINDERYRIVRAHLLGMATHRSAENLWWEFNRLPFNPYKPVQLQLSNVLRQVNKARQHVGYER